MAYVNQEKKAKIAAALKLVVPKDWKYSLAVRNHSTIVMTIASAPVDLLFFATTQEDYNSVSDEAAAVARYKRGYCDINHYHLDRHFSGGMLDTFRQIIAALNTENHDRSDLMTDYFDVGHYVDLNLGRFDKPFVCKGHPAHVSNIASLVARQIGGEL